MISYPETEQFRGVITKVLRYTRRREEDRDKELPVMKFIGTVKLHGTNSAIGYQKDSGHWCQSRNNIITPQKDNAGFAQFIDPLADELFNDYVLPQSSIIREQYEQGRKIIIFGEWCGGNIQKNVAICGLTKMFVIFKIRIIEENITTIEDENEDDIRVDKNTFWIGPKDWSNIKWHEKLIYNIYDFPTYEIDIDFNFPKLSQNKLIDITEAVERQCPVGEYFNKVGIGEGVVWTEWTLTGGHLTFKVKGEQHSVSKVKTLAPVDTEKLASIQEFIDYACTENRMLQGLDYLREQQLTIEMKTIGTFLKWLLHDIIKEEKDTMEKSNIDPKDIGRAVQSKAKTWFQEHLS
ncbi:unnamed protein product [Rotaria sp. Silwood2]|nr:unnamed protein product [Rotaria sp. Silwood2]CAF2525063.1 unnamed protein product [Rotaria sp. Silwood2]CAF2947951.1 unnamed protein product [Rotaria sp. Silwood2]CAF3981035.1 unnamed protein product [Rotaria sp. Silwood2]CAF4044911.1 unnamed protein product [Rotaria sp. Silwood2]